MGLRRPDGSVELVEYPFFEYLLLGPGKSALGNETQMFNRAQLIGNPQWTNMKQPGTLPSGGAMEINSLRAFASFHTLADTEYTIAYGAIAAVTTPTSSATRMHDCYNHLAYGFQVQLVIQDRSYLVAPWWAFPAGAGNNGFTTVAGRSVITSGVPSRQAVAFFKEGVHVESLAQTYCVVKPYPFQSTSLAGAFTGSAQGGTVADLDPKLFLNEADGFKAAGLVMGNVHSRD